MPHQTSPRAVLVDYDEDLFSPRGWEGQMLAEAGIEWKVGQHRTPEQALQFAQGSEVVMVQSVRRLLTRPVIERLHDCHCIIRLGIGFDSVDVAAATEGGILVCNVPNYCIDDVADHALALLLASIRHIARQDRWIRVGRWDRTGARPSRRLKGRTLGLVAFGRIARALAERVSGLGLELVAYDPKVDADTMQRYGTRKVELADLLRVSDFISVHAPHNAETHHILGSQEFEQMKDGVFLVNTSRGSVVDEVALVDALRSGKVWGAGLDVMEQEPLPANSLLRTFDNVVFTPHVSANSEESVDELYRSACEAAIEACHGRWPASVVNPEVAAMMPHVGQRRG